MKRNAVAIIFFLLIAPNVFAQRDTVLNRYKQYLLAGLKLSDKIDQLSQSIESNGRWNDIDYHDPERGNWKPSQHLGRVRDLAFAYSFQESPFYRQPRILQTALLALEHWLQNRYKSRNWWHNEIGVPQYMRDIIILLRSDLIGKPLAGAVEVLGQYRVQDNSTGANLTWSADLGLHYAMLTDNALLAQKCRDLVVQEIKITTKDGVQPDYSFLQHDKRLQMYQYGGAFLSENVRLAWELRGTSFAFPKDKINLLTEFLLQGWQWMTRGINTVPGTMDRSSSRKNALHSPDIRTLLPYLIDLIPERKAELAIIADHQNGKGALTGYRYYPYADFSVYHQNNFSFFLKTISTRTLATEAINNENLKGHLLNGGDAYVISDGQEYFNLLPVWNWEYLPGITGFEGADKIIRKPFVGSVGYSEAGFTTMDYLLENKDGSRSVSAKKSWFCYDNKVVSLIANLQGYGVDSAYTVMDQARWNSRVVANRKKNLLAEGNHFFETLKWVHHGNFVYVPLNKTAGEVKTHSLTGTWATINASESGEGVQEKIFLPTLLHRGVSNGVSFSFMTAFTKTPDGAKRIAKKPGCKIIRNDSLCQSVLFADGTLMVAFFQQGSVDFNKDRLSVNKACLVMINNNKMYISDPAQIHTSVVIQLSSQTYNVQLPSHGFSTAAIPIK